MDLKYTISDEEIRRSLQRRKKNREISSITGLLGGAALFYESERFLFEKVAASGEDPFSLLTWERLPTHLLELPFPVFLGLTLYALSSTILSLPYNFLSPRRVGMTLQGLKFAIKNEFHKLSSTDKEKLAAFYQQGAQTTKDALQRHRMLVQRQFLLGNTEQAFREAIGHFTSLDKFKYKPSLMERLYQRLRDYHNMQPYSLQPLPHIEMGFTHFSGGFLKLAKRRFQHAAKISDPLQPQINCLYAYALELLQRHQKGRALKKTSQELEHQWYATVNSVLSNPALVQQFHRLGESRHEVLEISGEGVLKDIFIFKRDNTPEYLYQEYQIEKNLHTLLGQNNLVAEPLAFLEHTGQHYLILRRIAGQPLRVVGEKEGWPSTLYRVVPSLVLFHTKTKDAYDHGSLSVLLSRDYHTFLREKAFERLQQHHSHPLLEETVQRLASVLEHYPQYPIHGDFHPDNILVPVSGFTFLDPEYMALATRESDYADLLEHHTVPLTESERLSILSNLHEQQAPQQSLEAFMRNYSHSALSRTFYMYSSLDASSYGMNPAHRQQAQSHYAQRILVNLHRIKEISEPDFQRLAAFTAVVDH